MTNPRSATCTASCLFLLTSVLGAQADAKIPAGAPQGFALIQKANLLKHAKYLASDQLQGRMTGSKGQLMAAEYIANHFKKLGLEPLGDKGKKGKEYFQKYPVERTYIDPKKLTVKVGSKSFKEGFLVLPAKNAGKHVSVKGSLVLAGRIGGRGGRLDFGGLKGKVPIIILRPRKGGRKLGPSGQFGLTFNAMARMKAKAQQCEKAGATAVVFCVLDDQDPLTTGLTYFGLIPGRPMLVFQGDAGMAGQTRNMRTKAPWVVVSSKITKKILAAMKLSEKDALGDLESAAATAKKAKGKGQFKITIKKDKRSHAVNVAAVLRGSGNNKNEALVYSAHMDHIGTRMDGDSFNGADDNASGSSGLLEIATAYAKAKEKPDRSIIFLSVSGEELGLWGSKYYSEHPTWPLKKIVANINIDMIGRRGDETGDAAILATPSNRHRKFSTMVQDAARIAKQLGLRFESGDKYYQRSDHYNFAVKGIPVVFFCNGEHADYHQVSDHADKLDGDQMETISRLAYWTGWKVANSKGRPKTIGRTGDWVGQGQ